MAVPVIMPKQGLQMTEGTIINWKVEEGDRVKAEQPILEIETDKLAIDVNAPADGVLLKIVRNEGENVPITELIGVIGEEGEDISGLLASADAEPGGDAAGGRTGGGTAATSPENRAGEQSFRGENDSMGRQFASPRAKMRAEEAGIDLSGVSPTGPEGLVIERDVLVAAEKGQPLPSKPLTVDTGPAAAVTPLAKKVASIHDVELRRVKGTGTSGRITKSDVMDALHTVQVEKTERGGHAGYLVPHSTIRRTIARRMIDSLSTAAQANHRMDVDVTELVRIRDRLKALRVNVSYTDMLIAVTAKALKETPLLNSIWTEEGLFIKEAVNIGIAVALDEGLIVPVVHNADALSLEEINWKRRELIEKVKSGTLDAAEMSGGTFTITNLGMFEIDSFTAIINQPESGILAVGRIREVPTVVDGTVTVHPMVNLSLTYDHRAVDGAPAAKFLQSIKRYIETPYLLL
jgi:pyruvate dehydrogenase E2 component (dihydrolipoamide acetyltransferase)